jgi:hypothetical protein
MPSGWLRWILEQHHFPFNLIYAKEIDGGSLKNMSYEINRVILVFISFIDN